MTYKHPATNTGWALVNSNNAAAARAAIGPAGVDFIGSPTEIITLQRLASVGELVLCDATANKVIITLPPAPANKSMITVQKLDSGPNMVIVNRSESDVFGFAGGPTVVSIPVSCSVQFTYSDGVWTTAGLQKSLPKMSAAERLFSRMTVQPDEERKRLIASLIDDLQTAGIWDRLDGLYVFAAHDRQAALLNWLGGGSPTKPLGTEYSSVNADGVPSGTPIIETMRDCTEVNAPTFTVDRGFAGDGRAAYLDTNTAGIECKRLSPTNATAGLYVRTVSDATRSDLAATLGLGINPSNTAGQTVVYAMHTGWSAASHGGDKTGLFGFSRSGTTAQIYKDGKALGSSVTVGGTLANNPIQPVCFLKEFYPYTDSTSGNGMYRYSPRQISAGFIGSSLTADQWLDLDLALSIYFASIGAAV